MSEDWREQGLCRSVDPAAFYPDDDDAVAIAAAQAMCARCPVQNNCLEHALANRERIGIWGGLTPAQRRRLLRRRTAA
jgi:WhiB family redox-sensing transcriptional regulator